MEFPRVAGQLFGVGEIDALVRRGRGYRAPLMGPVMKRLVPEGSLRDNLYTFHEALGALVLIVMVVRLARRVAFGVPVPDASMPPIEQRASLWGAVRAYILLFVTMILGWAGTDAYGDPVSVFGLFDFPAIIGKDQPLSDRMFVWHLVCGILDRADRHAPYRRGAVPLARQRRSRSPALAAGELSVARPDPLRFIGAEE